MCKSLKDYFRFLTFQKTINMNQTTNYIKQRLSLRQPLTEALEVVEKITDVISLEKTSDDTRDAFLKQELAKVKTIVPFCQDFERDFQIGRASCRERV